MITINNNTYELKKLSLGDTFILEKNGEPIWLVPDEVAEDVNLIMSYAGAAAKFLNEVDEDRKKVEILSGTKPDNNDKESNNS